MDTRSFDNQHLTLSNDRWTVELNFKGNTDHLALTDEDYNHQIQLCEPNDWTSTLAIRITGDSAIEKRCLLTGIDGGVSLQKASPKDKYQSVKLENDDLIMSLGFTLISLNLSSATPNWMIRPDSAEIFGFYDLEDDILLRGEVEIHRIDKHGNIKWRYSGRDIWVNPDGKPEVQILENTIHLTDFGSNEYVIDYNGNTLSDSVNPGRIDNREKLKKGRNYDGLLIGGIFTLGSLLLTLTFVIPIVSVFPGVVIESIVKQLVNNDPYSNVGKATIVLLTILFLCVLFIAAFKIRRATLSGRKRSKAPVVIAMSVMFFIVHSLGFYLYWGLALNYRSDGQLIFGAVESFPKSSWAFILIGFAIDTIKNSDGWLSKRD